MTLSASRFEPLMPAPDSELEALAVDVYRQSAALEARLHPLVRPVVREMVEKMNCYYSNLIEGHRTRLADIDAAMAKDYAQEAKNRNLQLLSLAHIQTESAMRERLALYPEDDVCSAKFLAWLHAEFCSRLPEEMLFVESDHGARREVVPGEMRKGEKDHVRVGEHYAPEPRELAAFLDRFHRVYQPEKLGVVERMAAWGASHHRLVWIHPFLDGNGRVARLFSTAYAIKTGVDAGGLWSISRGLARNETGDYKTMLSNADRPRMGDLDGRGNLSAGQLRAFCIYFQKTALDQIQYMSGLLELDGLKARIRSFVDKVGPSLGVRPEAERLLTTILERGELDRGEAPQVTGLGERTARDLLGELLGLKLLASPSPKGKVRFAVPAIAVEYYFPRLFYPDTPVSEHASRVC